MPRSRNSGRRRSKRVYRVTGGMRAIFEMETESINDVIRSMRDFNARARQVIVKRALRDFGSMMVKRIKANITWKDRELRRHVMQKVVRYPKGGRPETRKYLWLGVGVRTGARPMGKEITGRFGGDFPGWRAHLFEAGYRPWPKGRKSDDAAFAEAIGVRKRTGNYRGGNPDRARAILAFVRRENRWRKGKKRIFGGSRVNERRYMSRAAMGAAPLLRSKLEQSLEQARRESSRG